MTNSGPGKFSGGRAQQQKNKMKSNSVSKRSLGVVLLGLLFTNTQTTFGQALQQMSDAQLTTFLNQLDATPQLSADAVSKFGNFYSLAHPNWPPLPSNPGVPVWQMSDSADSYLLDDVNYSYSGQTSMRAMNAMSLNSLSGGPGDFSPADSPSDSPSAPPDISNYAKFMAQSFSVIDTNDAAANDSNLYNACVAFGDDTNTFPVLQISQYRPGCLLLKASHFDYSSESRDFCVVVCDKLETPLFKNMDIYAPSNNLQNGGWLVQGSVPQWQVTDPMFIVVSNISTVYNAFFRVVPYSGPVITLAGTNNPDDTVSNLISLQATVTDLSGMTNENWTVNIDGAAGRYSLGPTIRSPLTQNTIRTEWITSPSPLAIRHGFSTRITRQTTKRCSSIQAPAFLWTSRIANSWLSHLIGARQKLARTTFITTSTKPKGLLAPFPLQLMGAWCPAIQEMFPARAMWPFHGG